MTIQLSLCTVQKTNNLTLEADRVVLGGKGRPMQNFTLLILCLLSLNACVLNREFSDNQQLYLDARRPSGKLITSPTSNQPSLKITYFGVSTLLFDDGVNKILVDGFFTRPSIEQLIFFGVNPDLSNRKTIKETINRYELHNLTAIIAVHSHHDHAMDAPLIADITGAELVGSKSTCRLAIGLQLTQEKCYKKASQLNKNNEQFQFGDFEIDLIHTEHTKLPSLVESVVGVNERVNEEFSYPARIWDYAEGDSYSIYIKHPAGSIVVHANSALGPNELANVQADWVFMSVARLTSLPNSQQIFNSIAKASKAKNIVPIHWDDFSRLEEEKLSPQKLFLGNSIEEIQLLMKLNSQLDAPANVYILGFGDHVWVTNSE
ncbi:hypothetical protein AMBLS11_13715 [Alteromonas macleodii str. 'Black Sea 11']|nr:hypothetical protein AMBLS11_13715 [Alteromonas macleodii str. 'Black Sea 11']